MRNAARTMFAGLLALGLAFAAGCGSKPPSNEPNVAVVPDPKPGPDPNAGKEPVKTPEPPAKPAHEMDLSKHATPAAPVTGTLAATDFNPTVVIEGRNLVFQAHKAGSDVPERRVFLAFPAGAARPFDNRKLVIDPLTSAGPDVPALVIDYPGQPGKIPERFTRGYALTLELGLRNNGKRPGKVYLCLPDGEKSVIAGTFDATDVRPETEAPGPDEAPFVQGALTVRGVAPETQIRVGYAARPAEGKYCLGAALVTFAPLDAGRATSVRAETNRDPRITTTLLAGDGKEKPGRYDHVRLAPGRYLIYAVPAAGGPAAWKWVTVTPESKDTVDLTIDQNRTGGLEVSLPIEILGKVQMIPADEPGQPAADQTTFTWITLDLKLEREVVARKAVYQGLAPGRYEVRAGGRTQTVEVIAGKTVELDIEKKADPKPKP